MQQAPRELRRTFLGRCTAGLLALIGLITATPAVAYILAPLRRKRRGVTSTPKFEAVAAIADLPIGQWKLLPLEVVEQDAWEQRKTPHSVWVRREDASQAKITVLSPICPHLGCHVNWFPEKNKFVCPCHSGTYDADGRYLSGPPPRSLDPLETEIRGDELYVRWENFETGAAKRISQMT